MASSEKRRLSVSLVDVRSGHEEEFARLATALEGLLAAKRYGRLEMIADESRPLRFYAVRHWIDAAAAERCHADPEVHALTSKVYEIGSITHVVNGVRRSDAAQAAIEDSQTRKGDRRIWLERRLADLGRTEGDRRRGLDRRAGSRRRHDQGASVNLVNAARRARENANAAFSHFKVGAALESSDGTVITGCNIENATYGLTICAERVAMFKALSEGHRVFTRIAIVADTEAPTPPCGACRQILWEFGGDLEILLANLTEDTGTHQLKDLLPLPFDARLL